MGCFVVLHISYYTCVKLKGSFSYFISCFDLFVSALNLSCNLSTNLSA